MTTWAAKDPDAVLDYLYTIPLDEGDSVADALLESIAGTVNIDSQSRSGANVTAWLSGGVDGETSIFRISWTTTGGRDDDDAISLAVVESDIAQLVFTGYAKPAPAHLQMRYPAFASVSTSTIAYWLKDAERFVTNAWTEGDYAAGLMALAAHNMALAGYGTDVGAIGSIPAGLSRMRSGSLELNFTEAAANARATGSFSATRYGQEFIALRLKNRAGPIVSDTGQVEMLGWPVYPLGWL
jgi:hypothetical protein